MSALPAPLHQVFYISRSRSAPQEVEQILAVSRHHNRLRQVTGALLFTGGHFVQLLEGSAPALADTMAAIDADRRHDSVVRLIEGCIPERRFEAWSMAFTEAPGADDLIEQLLAGCTPAPERCERLVQLLFAPLFSPLG